jgi:hypothetical protein
LTSLGELVFEASFEALVQVVVGRVLRKSRELLALVQNFADEDAVDADASLAAEVHYARISVALFEEEMLVVLIDEVDFNFVEPLVEAFQHHVMPIRAEAEKLPEVCHVVFEDRHGDAWLKHAVPAAKLELPLLLCVFSAAQEITPEL